MAHYHTFPDESVSITNYLLFLAYTFIAGNNMEMKDIVIVGNVSDDPFSLDIGYIMGQVRDISDLVSLKTFANSEFCPRFLVNEEKEYEDIGRGLNGKTVIICSTTQHYNQSRNGLAMRTLILATAAKDNGAQKVILVEPDLFYSAQDRGPQGEFSEEGRSKKDQKKFDGQPFTSKLYAYLLKVAGVDAVITIHNHSVNVQNIFSNIFEGQFYNIIPDHVYADYIKRSDMVVTGKNGDNLILCAPDSGARPFAAAVHKALGLSDCRMITMQKERSGERRVDLELSPESQCGLEDLEGKDIIVLDDMVRTGRTIIESAKLLRKGNPNRICFGVSHFHSSQEGRDTLNSKALDEILTLNTIPSILNRDMQGRLRKKIVVLKIEKWISRILLEILGMDASRFAKDFYTVDMSSKNPRWRPSTII